MTAGEGLFRQDEEDECTVPDNVTVSAGGPGGSLRGNRALPGRALWLPGRSACPSPGQPLPAGGAALR
jgi:hypothetical protein